MEELLQAKRAYVSATQSLETLQREERVLEIGALGITGYAPTPALGAKLLTLVNSVTSLDSASNDVHALVDSLSSLHSSAEKSVWRVRRLDEQRRLLQGALERVEDLLDLRACLVGLSAAQASGDRAAIALNVSRFRALSRTLPMPEGDVATVRVAEEALVREVTADFDAAITAQQALTTTTTTTATNANGGEQQQQQQHTLALATSRRAAAEATIASCCQLLSLLGRGFVGVERYAAYLRATLSSDIATELRAAAISGVDFPLAALNTVSSLFSKAATALDSAEVLGGALFTSGEASSSLTSSSSSSAATAAAQVVSAATPAASSNGVVVVHSVVDAAAAKVVLSFTRSGRVAAALAGREAVRSGGGGVLRGASSSSGMRLVVVVVVACAMDPHPTSPPTSQMPCCWLWRAVAARVLGRMPCCKALLPTPLPCPPYPGGPSPHGSPVARTLRGPSPWTCSWMNWRCCCSGARVTRDWCGLGAGKDPLPPPPHRQQQWRQGGGGWGWRMHQPPPPSFFLTSPPPWQNSPAWPVPQQSSRGCTRPWSARGQWGGCCAPWDWMRCTRMGQQGCPLTSRTPFYQCHW